MFVKILNFTPKKKTKVIQTLGEHLRLRQQVIASAIIYFRRFYSKYSFKCIDPFLLAPTCLFLATKVEVIVFFFILQTYDVISSYMLFLFKIKIKKGIRSTISTTICHNRCNSKYEFNKYKLNDFSFKTVNNSDVNRTGPARWSQKFRFLDTSIKFLHL